MNFSNIGRSVACTLLMVVLASAQSNPFAAPCDCSVKCLEPRLASIDDRLKDIQKNVSTLNNPLIKGNCTIDLASFGYDDNPIYGYIRTNGGSSDQIYFPEDVHARYRGVTLMELDATTCTTRNRQRFDTYAVPVDRVQLLEALESATTGTIIVGVTADTPEGADDFQKSAGPFFSRYNMNLYGLQVRDKFAFIMQKGYPKKTVFERKPRYGESLQMKIALYGATVSDVTFKQL